MERHERKRFESRPCQNNHSGKEDLACLENLPQQTLSKEARHRGLNKREMGLRVTGEKAEGYSKKIEAIGIIDRRDHVSACRPILYSHKYEHTPREV